jgi:2-methylcitrate dehydratase PrpD
MSLTEQLVQLIRSKPVTKADLEAASLFVLDALCNAYAGRCTPQASKFLLWYASQGKDAGRQAFTIGALTHILETDDLHKASVTHPGCVIVPAALAVASRQNTSATEFLTAVLQGFEASCRIGNAVGPAHYRIWHNTATCGPFGSAMAVGSLSGLDDEQCVDALGNAGTQASGFWQFLETGAMSKHLHAGRAAEAGLVAADLAALGVTGPPAILEGDKGFFRATCPDADPEAVLRAPEDPWQLCLTSIKPWPCCRHTHPVVDAALELHETIAGQEIQQIEIATYQAALDVCNRPQTASEYAAKFSLQHCVYTALLDGYLGFESFGPGQRQRLAQFGNRISLKWSADIQAGYPEHWGGSVSVTLSDGSRHTASRSDCLGDPELPLDRAAMVRKAEELLRFAGWDEQYRQHRINTILELAEGSAEPDLFATIVHEVLCPGDKD